MHPAPVSAPWHALVVVTGVATAAVTARSTLPSHRWWGALALAGYTIAAVVALSPARRWWPAVAVGLCGVVPLVVLVVGRSRGWHHVAQSEVDVIETAARRLLHHGTPYVRPADLDPTARATHYSYVPYLPLTAVAGLPRALFGAGPLTDARIWLAAADAVLWSAIWRRATPVTRSALALVAASPLVTLPMAVGGHDVVIGSLVVLGALASAVALGLAAGMTALAWPLVWPFATMGRAWRRTAVVIGVAVVTALPVLVDPPAAWANLVLFPLGRTPARSPADAPSIGRLLASFPGGRAIDLFGIALTVGVVAVGSLVRPAADTSTAARRAAVAIAVLVALMPSSRVGYLLYPVALWALGWSLSPSATTRSGRPVPPPSRPAGR